MDFLHGIEWIMIHGHLNYFQNSPLGGRPNTRLRDHSIMNAHNHWFILLYHVREPAWIKIHWNSILLRAYSHTTSHYTWGSVTIVHDFGGVLGRPLNTFFWARNFMVTALSLVCAVTFNDFLALEWKYLMFSNSLQSLRMWLLPFQLKDFFFL